jgi:hypothetical protein
MRNSSALLRSADAIGGRGDECDEARAWGEDLVTASTLGSLGVSRSVQAFLWEWASGIVPVSDLKVDQSASVLIHPNAEQISLRR